MQQNFSEIGKLLVRRISVHLFRQVRSYYQTTFPQLDIVCHHRTKHLKSIQDFVMRMQFKYLDKETEKMNQTTRREVVVAFLMRTVQAYI